MSAEPTAFLYPFIEAEEHDAGALLVDLAASARSKIADSIRLRTTTLERLADDLAALGTAIAERFSRGGRLLAFGNGGSATDAAGVVALFARPAPGSRPSLPAIDLGADTAVLTALGNDIGFDVVFARQVAAVARPEDVALGISTSGGSANVLAGLAAARSLGLLTVGICGYGGGAMAASGDVDICLTVGSDSVHRIQESQDAVLRALRAHVDREREAQG